MCKVGYQEYKNSKQVYV